MFVTETHTTIHVPADNGYIFPPTCSAFHLSAAPADCIIQLPPLITQKLNETFDLIKELKQW